jgi:RloB-like protein
MSAKNRTRLIPRGEAPLAPRLPGIRYVVVATEDTYAAGQYLLALQERGIVDRGHIRIIPLPTEDGRSALSALLDRLEKYREELTIKIEQDEYWAIFDIDHHRVPELSRSVEDAKNRGHRLAGSNPCFELWLLLHLTDDITGIASSSENRHAPYDCEQRLRETLQGGDPQARGYNKTDIGAERFVIPQRVQIACARARALSPATSEPWPQSVGTHVHMLIERLPLPPAPLPVSQSSTPP